MKNKKNLLCMLLAIVMVVSAFVTFSATEDHFTDVPADYWAHDSIERAYSEGVVKGTGGDAENHTGVFSPGATLSAAQFAVILTRAFYGEEVDVQTAAGNTSPWYAAAVAVGDDVGLFTNTTVKWTDATAISGNINRYNMAAMVDNILRDKGVKDLDNGQIWETSLGIPDYEDEDAYGFRMNMAAVVFHGIITGTDDKGTFSGNAFVTRAQAATIYCRLADVLKNNGVPVTPTTPTETETPTKPTETEPPVNTDKPSGVSGAVGTISDETVALSLSTHKCPTDYWSSASADVKALTDKDMFNAAVQTMKDHEMITSEGNMVRGVNQNYNYACYQNDNGSADQKIITMALSVLSSPYRAYSPIAGVSIADATDLGIVYCALNAANSSKMDGEFTPIFSKFTSGMSDHDKVEVMVQAMCDRFEYGDDSFTWVNGKSVGECKSYANAFSAICSAADIPVIYFGADSVNHAWNLVYIDGTWYYVDVSGDPSPTFVPESEMAGQGVYDIITEDPDYIKVAKGIIEAAY